MADKLHNATAILEDYRRLGPAIWERFKGGRDGTLWYYRSLAEVFYRRSPEMLANCLDRVVEDLEAAAMREASRNRTRRRACLRRRSDAVVAPR